ncbi:MAG: radical SAM protein [Armatimonadetes bacterium]|nr:radical SAM protein [Armatimonadota bacterium]
MVYLKVNPNLHSLTKGTIHDISEKIYLEYRKKWHEYPKNFYVSDFPLHLDIEISSYCNLKCLFCLRQVFDISDGFMEWEFYKKIIDEGSRKGLYAIKLSYRGEPLLHPLIFSMIKYAKEKGIIDVCFNTNAVKLTKEVSEELIDAGLDKIFISFEGYTKEFYEKNRIGANFEEVLNNIKNLQNFKKERKSFIPQLRIQTVLLPELNSNDLEKYVNFWKEIADQVVYLDYQDESGEHRGSIVDWACPFLWQRLTITYDGKILPCCHDFKEYSLLNNIDKITIEEAWKCEKEKKLRNLHQNGQAHKILSCDMCAFRASQIKLI